VYYKTTEVFNQKQGLTSAESQRTISLTKFAPADWRAGWDPVGHQEHPAHHRYPIWWTGDSVGLQASVESTVDAGLHDFKPYVHSDCGGDYRGSAGDLLRWTAHCAFGPILRFHGADHRLWSYNNQGVVDVARQYLEARYKLLPSLIAAGHRATQTGFPLVARGDFYWPELADSASNQQYICLDDIVVAPIWDSSKNETTRSVWVPPGAWQDAWNGSVVHGPKTLTVTQPYERQPMWHRREGGLLVLAGQPGTRVDDQDWSTLTLEAFPSRAALASRRTLFERGTSARTEIALLSAGDGTVQLTVSASEDSLARAWLLRVHLFPGQHAANATINGAPVLGLAAAHIQPGAEDAPIFPFGGPGSAPAKLAGSVVEIPLEASKHARVVKMHLHDGQ